MNDNNEKDLENFISSYINNHYKDEMPTEEQFDESAQMVRENTKLMVPVSDEQFKDIKRRLRECIVVSLDEGICLSDPNSKHESWLPANRAKFSFFFWERYKRYLEQDKKWNPRLTAKLSKVSDDVLDQCGNPQDDSFHIRGLLLGEVQSGKTSNYTAIANKAADVGYDVIIVLTGIPEILRQQTQGRLDKEMCGHASNAYLNNPNATIKHSIIGVGNYGREKNIASFTSEASDFNAAVLKSNNLAIGNVNCPILLVVKKNKSILTNLYKWLRYNNVSSDGKIAKSLLIIDDEADNASINTNDEDSDPTAINKAIREILSVFTKTTYLAVTATPFANIFIDPEPNDDLFPADFIYALDSPNNYIGPNRIFSDSGDEQKMLENIDVGAFAEAIPLKHNKNFEVKVLPADLYEAANYFLLANAIRDYRKDNTEHRTMMVHITRFTNVQKQIAEILNGWLEQVKSDLRNYSKLPEGKTERIKSINALHAVWNKYSLSKIAGIDWPEILHNYLLYAAEPVDVKKINSAAGADTLDYNAHEKDGLRVIVVGGNTLSRGLTLEGLMVTYFCRRTNMYDTLMQMGRWFGFRPNYDDLVKIWLSQEMIDAYGDIYTATQDLKDQIYKMKAAGQSPRDFGLKVRYNPGSLIVTARNKMRTAQTITVPVSVAGQLLETPRLYKSKSINEKNCITIEAFIERLDDEGKRVDPSEFRTFGNYFWENVSNDCVAQFLKSIIVHPWNLGFNSDGLSDYVTKHAWNRGWDVTLINNGEGIPYDKKLKCGNNLLSIAHTEYRSIQVIEEMFRVSGTKMRVGSGGCARIGLTKEQIEYAKKQFYSKYSGKQEKPSLPDTAYLIKGRKPILMIHVIQAKYENAENDYPRFLYGLGVGFPDDEAGNETALYVINRVEQMNWFDDEESD